MINHFMAADTGDYKPREVTLIGSWFVWKAFLWLAPYAPPLLVELPSCLRAASCSTSLDPFHSKQSIKCFCQELPSALGLSVLAGTVSSLLQDTCPELLSLSSDWKNIHLPKCWMKSPTGFVATADLTLQVAKGGLGYRRICLFVWQKKWNLASAWKKKK